MVKWGANKINKEGTLVRVFKRAKGNVFGFSDLIDLVQLIGLWSLILKSEALVVRTALRLFV